MDFLLFGKYCVLSFIFVVQSEVAVKTEPPDEGDRSDEVLAAIDIEVVVVADLTPERSFTSSYSSSVPLSSDSGCSINYKNFRKVGIIEIFSVHHKFSFLL